MGSSGDTMGKTSKVMGASGSVGHAYDDCAEPAVKSAGGYVRFATNSGEGRVGEEEASYEHCRYRSSGGGSSKWVNVRDSWYGGQPNAFVAM
eukprot:14108318-Alexandrium_andersonii.AAC.1